MPTYEYSCQDCRKRFQIVESIGEHDPKAARCPKCRSRNVKRIWDTVRVHTSRKS